MVKLAEFMSNLNKVGGISKTNFFAVQINTPPALKAAANDARNFSLLCNGTNLPGLNIGVDDHYLPQGYGVTQRMPWGVNFTDTNFSFYADNRGVISNLLTSWANAIVEFNVETVDNKTFLVNYRKDYSTDIKIMHYDPTQSVIMEYTLHDAYPGSIYDQSMTWSDQNTLNMITVRMLFTRWTVKYQKLSNPETNLLNVLSSAVGSYLSLNNTVPPAISNAIGRFDFNSTSGPTANFVDNVQQAIPLISGSSLGNLRF